MLKEYSGPVFIIIAALLWAFDGLIRQHLYSLPPITIIFFEHLIGLIILAPFVFKYLFTTKLSKKEWWLVSLFSLAVVCLTTAPYVYGFFAAPDGTSYNGLHVLNPTDVPVYYSYIAQAKNGQLFGKDLFTAEPQSLGTFNVWWSGVGLLAKIFSLSVPLAFQLARILMIPIFMVAAYLFLAYFFKVRLERLVALVFLIFSSGLGFYVAAPLYAVNLPSSGLYHWPIDLWISEAITFVALFQTSHFIASITLTILIFLLLLLCFERNKVSYAVLAGGLGLFYFNFHPYYFPVIFGVAGLYLLILMLQASRFLWKQAGYLLITFFISLPAVGYHMWLLSNSPVIAQRALQNVTPISPWPYVLVGYGLLWLGLILGVYFLVKNKVFENKHLFLLLWLAVNLTLIYSPFPFQSRYTQGLHVVLVIFTTHAVLGLYQAAKQRLAPKTFDFWINNPYLATMGFLILFMPSVFYCLARDVYAFSQTSNDNLKKVFFLPKDLYAAAEYLSQQPRGTVLAAEIPAEFIPALSGQSDYVAHGQETLFYYSKIVYRQAFYSDSQNLAFKKNFLQKNSIDYVLFSQYEKELGSFDPTQAAFLKLVFDRPEVKVYQFVTN